MEDINILCEQLDKILKEIQLHSSKLLSLEPVTHLSRSMIQWHGGIIGAVQEHREYKLLVKMLNEPILGEKTFYQLCFWGCRQTEKAVALQLKIQESTSKDDPIYFQKACDIVQICTTFVNAYFHYSPDMASALITVEEEEDVSLGISLQSYVHDELAKLDLPPEVEEIKKPLPSDNSGCLGVFIVMVMGALSLLILGGYEMYHYLA